VVVETALKLDLGCGQTAKEGFIGVDISADCGADVVHDLRVYPWPFESDSVDEVFSSHFLEHVPGHDRFRLFDELWRILKVDAQATIVTPYWASMRAIQDPTHEWPPISEASYLYTNRQWREDNKLDHYPISCNFDYTYAYNINDRRYALSAEEARAHQARYYNNVIDDLHVVLTKKA